MFQLKHFSCSHKSCSRNVSFNPTSNVLSFKPIRVDIGLFCLLKCIRKVDCKKQWSIFYCRFSKLKFENFKIFANIYSNKNGFKMIFLKVHNTPFVTHLSLPSLASTPFQFKQFMQVVTTLSACDKLFRFTLRMDTFGSVQLSISTCQTFRPALRFFEMLFCCRICIKKFYHMNLYLKNFFNFESKRFQCKSLWISVKKDLCDETFFVHCTAPSLAQVYRYQNIHVSITVFIISFLFQRYILLNFKSF